MEIIYNSLEDKKDVVRANNSVNTVKDILGQEFKCIGVLIFEKEGVDEKTGEQVTNTVVALKSEDGEFYTSISPTVKGSIEAVIGVYDKEEFTQGIDMVVKSKESNNGRDFYYIDLV